MQGRLARATAPNDLRRKHRVHPQRAGREARRADCRGLDRARTTAPRPKPPGHGRNAAAAYTGAEQITVAHPALHGGEACPGCESGKLYPQSEPAKLVRITGMAPLSASVYACDRLRCNLCGEVFTAPAPEGVGPEKYDATATSMVGLLKYGAGLPFNRIEKLQDGMGIPLPAATQWDLVRAAAKPLAPPTRNCSIRPPRPPSCTTTIPP
jgi:transposase